MRVLKELNKLSQNFVYIICFHIVMKLKSKDYFALVQGGKSLASLANCKLKH